MRACCVSETQPHGRRTKTVLNQVFVELNRRREERVAKIRAVAHKKRRLHRVSQPRAAHILPQAQSSAVSPDFLAAALDMTACAAFITESRMKFANPNKLHRKSGSG